MARTKHADAVAKRNEADWVSIEIDYRLGEIPIDDLAALYGVDVLDIECRAQQGEWHDHVGVEGALHPKYLRYIDEYIKDWDREAARKRAGLHRHTTAELWSNQKIKAQLYRRLQESSTRAGLSADGVVARLLKIADADIRKLYTADGNLKRITDLDDDTAFALGSVEVEESRAEDGSTVVTGVRKVKMLDRLGAIRDLGKHLSMFVERTEITGKDGGPVEVKDLTPTDKARRIAFLLTQAVQQPEKKEQQA